jgi:ribonuclease III
MKDLAQLQEYTKTSIQNMDILRTAFTHRSYLNEAKVDEKGKVLEHNERLEFLGDAVLELVVTEHLYKLYPNKPEGELTAVRAALVNTVSICEAAKQYHMNDFLMLSKGEARDTGRARDVILANVFEAFLGALYLDKGYAGADEFIARALLTKTKEIVDKKLWRDPKSLFQEIAQEKHGITPSYAILRDEGLDHDKDFVSGIFIGKDKIAEGKGKSKQEAEAAAARNGLVAKGW